MRSGRTIPLDNLTRATRKLSCKLKVTDQPRGSLLLGRGAGKTVLVLPDFMSLVYRYNWTITPRAQLARKSRYLVAFIFYFFFERIFYKHLSVILVQTDHELEYARRLGLSNCKKLTNWVRPVPKTKPVMMKRDKLAGRIRVGLIAKFDNIYALQFLALLSEYKRQKRADITFIVAGEGSEKFKNIENVIALGFVKDKYEFYRQIDVSMCLSFKNYGFINKVPESIMYKRPVIASQGALNEVSFLEKRKCICIVDSYRDALNADYIQKILSDQSDEDFLHATNELLQHVGRKNYFEQLRLALHEISPGA